MLEHTKREKEQGEGCSKNPDGMLAMSQHCKYYICAEMVQ